MHQILAALCALLLVAGCGGGGPAAPEGGDPEATLRTWSDAMGSGDWRHVAELTCSEVDPEFASDDESAIALLDAASVRFEILQIEPAIIKDEAATVAMNARYALALDTARLRASLGDTLLAAGAPSADIEKLAGQAVDFIVAGARTAIDQRTIRVDIPFVREEGAWRVCAPGFSPLTLAFPTAN